MRAALTDLGHQLCDDFHAEGATGVSRWALTVRDGQRVSTNDAYLEPARSRPNLAVRGDVLVDRVVVAGTRARAVLAASGEEIEAGEVIVSAGAIHSPAILLRSGLGEVLPVGRNLKEHAATPGFEVALKAEARKASVDSPVFGWLLRYTSDLAIGGPNDMQMLWFDNAGPGVEGLAGARIIGAVMRVASTGTVTLRTSDPNDDPIVRFDMLSDWRDFERLRDAVHRMIEVVNHPAVAAIADGVVALDRPVAALDSDTAIEAWLRAHVTDYVHAVGTCRMGRADDPAAVVDTDCRVIGVSGLRVCDASIMPDLPAANTHLTTVALAERLAAKIRG
jgi:choline dehydrogenase-like flavoprotein